MKVFKRKIDFSTKSQIEFVDLTDKVQEVIDHSGIREGQVLVYSPHTTMGVSVNHNEPMLVQDFMRILYRLVPTNDQYNHDLFELKKSNKIADGRSNGHSHCKALLLGSSETLPIEKGKVILTERQSIFVIEFDGARKRDVIVQVIGI